MLHPPLGVVTQGGIQIYGNATTWIERQSMNWQMHCRGYRSNESYVNSLHRGPRLYCYRTVSPKRNALAQFQANKTKPAPNHPKGWISDGYRMEQGQPRPSAGAA